MGRRNRSGRHSKFIKRLASGQLALRFPGDACVGESAESSPQNFEGVRKGWHIDGCASDFLPGETVPAWACGSHALFCAHMVRVAPSFLPLCTRVRVSSPFVSPCPTFCPAPLPLCSHPDSLPVRLSLNLACHPLPRTPHPLSRAMCTPEAANEVLWQWHQTHLKTSCRFCTFCQCFCSPSIHIWEPCRGDRPLRGDTQL